MNQMTLTISTGQDVEVLLDIHDYNENSGCEVD